MKILIIGQGGREHALAWKLSQNELVNEIFIAAGNPGCQQLAKVSIIDLATIDELLTFATQQAIGLTLVGSEELLVAGIVDRFQAVGLAIFGPNRQAAQLEGSKAFAKDFMTKYGIKTAKYQSFNDYAAALAYLEQVDYPLVIKASGLAAGKGVVIAQDHDQAERTLAAMLLERLFGESGSEIIIEEYLDGVEASILAFTDCHTILPLISAKDHKKINDGETGLNTGGMGVIAPNPYVTAEINQQFEELILKPTLRGLQSEKMDFAGVVFFGLMLTKNGVYLLEYNMRLGDPETQAVLPLLESDLLEVIQACLAKKLSNVSLKWSAGATCCVVMAAGGYPEQYPTGLRITGIEEFQQADCYLFTAGVAHDGNNYVTSGGRVLNVVAKGHDLATARARAYQAVAQIKFQDCYYRNDIGMLVSCQAVT